MDQQAQQLIDRIKQAQNVLVTVSANPSVDQLAAAIGLTIALNKFDKHGTAVFSGRVPSTIEFLKPETTLERNTDSLRDFIIALDKSKADKLRYKVEDQVVRIFITPYKTSLSEKDLDFSQGDFNVDVVVALGVTQQQDLDAAITAHGRILHDATVASVSLTGQGDLGTINYADPSASSLSEMMLGLIDGFDKKLLDNQIATALLTGIVASTDRFRNEKTSPRTMSISAELMAAGANPQLIASELETPPPAFEPSVVNEPVEPSEPVDAEAVPSTSGELDIDHDDDDVDDSAAATEDEPEAPEPPPQIHVDKDGTLSAVQTPVPEPPEISQVHGVKPDDEADELDAPEVRHERLSQPPTLGDTNLTANTVPEALEPATEELTLPPVSAPLLTHNEAVLPPPPGQPAADSSSFIPQMPFQPPPSDWTPPDLPVPPSPAPAPLPDFPAPDVPVPPLDPVPAFAPAHPAPPVSPASASLRPDETLTEIEEAVRSPHLQSAQPDELAASSGSADGVDEARDAVQAAFNGAGAPDAPLQPIAALNAQPLGPDLHDAPVLPPPANTGFSEPTPGNTPADAALDMPLPSNPFGPGQQALAPSSFPGAPNPANGQQDGLPPPPPVPPPMLPPLQ